ncbi:MAG: Fur family transcriptional regulator [Deltaproteobacteria bacterium]
MQRAKCHTEILAGIKQSGMKLTPQRRSVVEILTRDYSHPSAKTVFQTARNVHPKIILSTVYATLYTLKSLKLIRELEFQSMENRYDMNTEHHLHLICNHCGRIDDVADYALTMPKNLEKSTGFKAHDYRFELYGLCSWCN